MNTVGVQSPRTRFCRVKTGDQPSLRPPGVRRVLPLFLFLFFLSPFSMGQQEEGPALTRLAQPGQYFDRIGTRAAVMGYESGSFEAWIWPWKPLRAFELSFLLGTSTIPVTGRDIVRTISTTPSATVLTYTHEAFTVRETIVVPREEPGVLVLLAVRTTTPLTIVAGFVPVMQPMWPAGIGGQFSYWDDEAHGYVISEGRWRAVFLCGSPAAKQMAAPPAHMFADSPLQFRIDVQPGTARDEIIPVAIAGGQGMSTDSVRAVHGRLCREADRYLRESREYFSNFLTSTLQISTPNPAFNEAFAWGKVALDNLLITNPLLGRGLVAGYGLSGGGARPGFAWFFGGDAFINALAFDGFGAHATVRDALAFSQRWQRQADFPVRRRKPDDPPKDVGKMAHELSQSDGLCDWWNDYHYGYNHADTTPWYLVAMGDYVSASGDLEFLRSSWPSVVRAYQWCLSKDSDGDGLMDLKGAGLGALEFGKLVGIYADAYTCGVWAQAIRAVGRMAALAGDDTLRRHADAQWEAARTALEKKFWMEKEGIYSYGATATGEQVRERTPWAGAGMMFGVMDSARTVRCVEALSGADICTDWGVRSLARSSPLFEPTNYNYGAVWPFIGSFFNTAQFRYGFAQAGYQILEATVAHATGDGIGVVPEVFSGELNQKLAEAYHHQGFSTTGYMLPMIRGLLGLEVNATDRLIRFAPAVPADWDSVTLRCVRIGGATYDLVLNQSATEFRLAIGGPAPEPVRLQFTPLLPPGSEITSITLNGRTTGPTAPGTLEVRTGDRITISHTAVPVILPPPATGRPGASNSGFRVISCRKEGRGIRVRLEGLAGTIGRLPIAFAERIGGVEGAVRAGNTLEVTFPPGEAGSFVRRELLIIPMEP